MTVACYIPSKGRPHSTTHTLFTAIDIPAFYVVEPQDHARYVANGLPVVMLPDNDRGLCYSRNWILDHARNVDIAFMCDDDVQRFGHVVNKRCQPSATVTLHTMLDVLAKNRRVIVGLEYRQRSWSHAKPFAVNNGWIDVCIAFRPAEITARYQNDLELKEDRDWQLQNISRGIDLIRYNHGYFECPDIGTNVGGLHEKYQRQEDHYAAARMFDKWKPFVQLQRKNDRIDVKADWPLIRTRLRGTHHAHVGTETEAR